MNRWAMAGVLDRWFEQLQRPQIVPVKIESVALDSGYPMLMDRAYEGDETRHATCYIHDTVRLGHPVHAHGHPVEPIVARALCSV